MLASRKTAASAALAGLCGHVIEQSPKTRVGRLMILLVLAGGSAAAWQRAAAESPASASLAASAFQAPAAPGLLCRLNLGLPVDPALAASAHERAGGLPLVAAETREPSMAGHACDTEAPVRRFDIVAIQVDITLNRYLDHDPEGRMYVLADELARARAEEAANARARAGQGEPAVSAGLQGDAIQPLTLRVLPGECLRIGLRNDLPAGEPASLHLHGGALLVAGTDRPAVAANAEAIALPGQTVEYEWMVPSDEPEGTHYFHSQGRARFQADHGLFGALIVEPEGSRWIDPRSGAELASGWDAIIQDPSGSDFREFALYYHEIGDESYRILDKAGEFVPQVDPLTSAYRPDGRALNYRSEPFMNRLALQQSLEGRFDESVAYSSYSFGDPATPILRAYIGDPTKERVIHGGSEVFHVHHLHGGATRWNRQPDVEPTRFDAGLQKHPPLRLDVTERIDAQGLGPSETFDVANECGAGGCQQSVGDFLYHCHIAQHYFAGMWGLWRVYNTRQDGPASTDALPPLGELTDRAGRAAPGVASGALVGRTIDMAGRALTVKAGDLAGLVERQLPPAGRPIGYDASVLDWRREGDTYYGEVETDRGWPGYQPRAPGARPALLFDPGSGRLAYPFLRPHLGRRPPFAPNHGPAPYLDPNASGTDVPAPGANGPESICPAGTRVRSFALRALAVPIPINAKQGLVDAAGELFVLAEDAAKVRADPAARQPLALRANAGEDCVDVTLASELGDNADNKGFSKVNAHIHFAQFDVQASDGVIAGFNYEQSVRPYAIEGERLRAAAPVGAERLVLASVSRFQPGILVGIGFEDAGAFEVRRIQAVEDGALVLDSPLEHDHAAGESVSTEFVRYRWYPDVQSGTAYFHDHVNGLVSWRHGLFGALIAEPPGSTYHDPRTGREIDSGPVADIRTAARVAADLVGSFRELVLFIQDDSPVNHVGRSTGSAYNLRAEPLDDRPGDPARLFSSAAHGDPATPILETFLGDPVVVRALVSGTNDVHTWHIDGHWTRVEPSSLTSPPVSTVHLGISERYDLVIPRAGGPSGMPGDYLYYSGRSFKLREGSWGILRVRPPGDTAGLAKLPGHEVQPSPPSAVCPADAPRKAFAVSAVTAPLPMLAGRTGKVFVLRSARAAADPGALSPEPLVLHVNVGDCLTITLANETTDGPVSFHADMLAYDPRDSGGVEAGVNPPQAVAPGASRSYTFYAHPEVGETTALVRDWGNVLANPGLGLYGAIVVGPRGARYRDPVTGADAAALSSWRVEVRPPDGTAYRDFTLFLQDEDESIGNHRMPYTTKVRGPVGLNYRAAPLEVRAAAGKAMEPTFRDALSGEPPTPLLEAYAGDAVKIHVLAPWSEQAHVFSIEGHRWPFEPGRRGTPLLGAMQIGGLEAVTLDLVGGAGGPERLAGDYVYGDHRGPYLEAGLWGLLRVHDARTARGRATVRPLSPACAFPWLGCDRSSAPVLGLSAILVIAGIAVGGVWYRRRRRREALNESLAQGPTAGL